MNDVLSFGMHRLWKQYAIDRAEIRSGMKVLDIAGGTGDMSLLVQKKLSGTGEVWLSDINHEMLKIGDERLKMPVTILMFLPVMRSICPSLTGILMSSLCRSV